MNDSLPTTDAKAIKALREMVPGLEGQVMALLFECRRQQGDSILRAYETAMLAYVEPSADVLHCEWKRYDA